MHGASQPDARLQRALSSPWAGSDRGGGWQRACDHSRRREVWTPPL